MAVVKNLYNKKILLKINLADISLQAFRILKQFGL